MLTFKILEEISNLDYSGLGGMLYKHGSFQCILIHNVLLILPICALASNVMPATEGAFDRWMLIK